MPAVLAFLIGQIAQSLWLPPKIFPFSGAVDRDFVRSPLPAASLAEYALGSSADFNQRVTGSIPVVPTTQSCRTGYFSVGLK